MNNDNTLQLDTGLYKWYPMEEGAVIVVGLNGDLPELGKYEASSVDYIAASYLLEESADPIAVLSELRRVLKPTGHLLLAAENRFGLRYFCGDRDPYTDKSFDGIEKYRNFVEADVINLDGRLYSDYEIGEMLSKAGFSRYQRLSILPGLEMPQQMYASDYLPEEEIEIRFTGLYHCPETVFLNEGGLYDGIIKNDMFHQMANAYLYDCSPEGDFYEINHVTTSMDRGPQKATATIIQKDGKVIKKAICPEGNAAIDRLVENTTELQKRGIKVVPLAPMEYAGGIRGVEMPYVKLPTALTFLRGLFHEDREEFIAQTRHFIELILSTSGPVEPQPAGNELGPIYQKAYADMMPLNAFYDGTDFVFYDQEYCEENYPIYAVVLRALDIIYMNDKAMLSELPAEYFLQGSGIENKTNVLRGEGIKFLRRLRNRDALADFLKEHSADLQMVNSNRQKLNYSLDEYTDIFINLIKPDEDRDIYVFGAGFWARKFIAEYGDVCHIVNLIDNNTSNAGKIVDGIEVAGPEVLKGIDQARSKVIICVKNYAAVLNQIKRLGIENFGIYDPYAEVPQAFQKQNANALSGEAVADGSSHGGAAAGGFLDLQPDGPAFAKPYKVGYIAGVFDLFHIGHLNLLKRAKEQCEHLIVGVVSDEQATKGKNRSPYVNESERMEIVRSSRYVDEVFLIPIMAAASRDIYKKYHFDVQFSGSDYEHDEYWLSEQAWLRKHGSDIVFFPYTQSTSSTKLKDALEK